MDEEWDTHDDDDDDDLMEPVADDAFFYDRDKNSSQMLHSPDALNDFLTCDNIPNIMDDMNEEIEIHATRHNANVDEVCM
jgi:hypothetical protein